MLGLEGRGVSCCRGNRTLFSGLDFSVRAGEALLVRGSNGSGKTTLLRAIAGLLPLTSGQLQLCMESGSTERAEEVFLAGKLQYIGHADGVKLRLSVRENLAFWKNFFSSSAVENERNLEEILEIFSLQQVADFLAADLSAGQRRKLALSRLLLGSRPLWLLDEPTEFLDSCGRSLLSAMLREHCAAGGMAVVTTHTGLEVVFSQYLDLG